jgi:hypothetical protein
VVKGKYTKEHSEVEADNNVFGKRANVSMKD